APGRPTFPAKNSRKVHCPFSRPASISKSAALPAALPGEPHRPMGRAGTVPPLSCGRVTHIQENAMNTTRIGFVWLALAAGVLLGAGLVLYGLRPAQAGALQAPGAGGAARYSVIETDGTNLLVV